MHVTADLAQRIVNVIMAIVHCNVNLMDARGVIIGSGHPRRIGTVHEGARLAANSGKTVEIFPEDVPHYPGALEGINMPIMIDGKVLAVVGLYGEPTRVRDTACLVRSIAAHIIEQEGLYQESGAQIRLREEFLVHLTCHRGLETPPMALQLASSLGFDLSLRRYVVMANVGADEGALPPLQEYRPPALVSSRMMEIESMLRGSGVLRGADFLAVADRRLAILVAVDGDVGGDESIRQVAALQRRLSDFLDLPVACGAGGAAEAGDLSVSRRQAEFAAAHCTARRRVCWIHEKDILLNYLRTSGMAREGQIAARSVLNRFDRLFFEKPQLRQTLIALLDENRDCSAAALRLGLHRNTLSYRLDQFITATGLSPCHNFADAALCWFFLGPIQKRMVEAVK